MKVIKEKLDESIAFMRTVKRDRKYSRVRNDCLNKVPDCTLWAAHVSIDCQVLVII